jgi:hypothetical protein
LDAVSYHSGVWGTPFSIFTNAIAAVTGFSFTITYFACVDSVDTIHLYAEIRNTIGSTFFFHQFHQAILIGGMLGPFELFAALPFTTYGYIPSIGRPNIIGANLVLPFVDDVNGLGIYVGTPLAAPVWTRFDGLDLTPYLNTQPMVANFGGKISIIYTLPSGLSAAGLIRIAQTLDFTTWIFTGTTVFDLDTPPGLGELIGNQLYGPILTQQGIAVTSVDSTGTYLTRAFLPLSGSPPPPSISALIHLNQLALPTTALPNPAAPNCK